MYLKYLLLLRMYNKWLTELEKFNNFKISMTRFIYFIVFKKISKNEIRRL